VLPRSPKRTDKGEKPMFWGTQLQKQWGTFLCFLLRRRQHTLCAERSLKKCFDRSVTPSRRNLCMNKTILLALETYEGKKRKKNEQILAPYQCVSNSDRIKHACHHVKDVKHFTGPYLQRVRLFLMPALWHFPLLRPTAVDAFNLHKKVNLFHSHIHKYLCNNIKTCLVLL